MRAIVFVAALTLATPAHADSFVEIVGGLMNPIEDEDWSNLVDESAKLGLRVGSVQNRAGGMLSVDWTPLNTDYSGFTGGPFGSSVEVSANRFRVLANGVFHHRIGNNLIFSGRAGLGVDITHVNVRATILGSSSEDTDSDSGIALELGGGVWFKTGSLHIGGEIGIPFAFHEDEESDQNDYDDDYNSIDVDLLFGVRFVTN